MELAEEEEVHEVVVVEVDSVEEVCFLLKMIWPIYMNKSIRIQIDLLSKNTKPFPQNNVKLQK